jgi:hypothetical protein
VIAAAAAAAAAAAVAAAAMEGGPEAAAASTVAIFPPAEGALDLARFAPVAIAQADLGALSAGCKEEEVNVVVDDEVDDQVVELLGTYANLGFALADMKLPLLVLHVKNLTKFVRIELVLSDTAGRVLNVSLSNRQSVVRAKTQSASLPLKLAPGWNRICLDLRTVCARAFGAQFHSCAGVRVFANCRIWRLFFQQRDYADDELPAHLRVMD